MVDRFGIYFVVAAVDLLGACFVAEAVDRLGPCFAVDAVVDLLGPYLTEGAVDLLGVSVDLFVLTAVDLLGAYFTAAAFAFLGEYFVRTEVGLFKVLFAVAEAGLLGEDTPFFNVTSLFEEIFFTEDVLDGDVLTDILDTLALRDLEVPDLDTDPSAFLEEAGAADFTANLDFTRFFFLARREA